MKTQKITVNKTPDNAAGQEIEVVVPEGQMEERMLSFSLTMFLRELKRENRIDYDLPARLDVAYQAEGRFVVRGYAESNSTYYEASRPIALVGLRWTNGRFDLIHAGLGQPQAKREEAAAASAEEATAPQAEPAPSAEQGEADKAQ